MNNPVYNTDISKLVTALVKSQTLGPCIKSPLMPVASFCKLFTKWPDNSLLSIMPLHLKAIMLMDLKIALKATVMDGATMDTQPLIFSSYNIVFHDSGHMSVTFHGVKNDYSHDGFTVKIPPASNKKLDLVTTLKDYVTNTALQCITNNDGATFLLLVKPYHGL